MITMFPHSSRISKSFLLLLLIEVLFVRVLTSVGLQPFVLLVFISFQLSAMQLQSLHIIPDYFLLPDSNFRPFPCLHLLPSLIFSRFLLYLTFAFPLYSLCVYLIMLHITIFSSLQLVG